MWRERERAVVGQLLLHPPLYSPKGPLTALEKKKDDTKRSMAHQPWKMCKGANQSCLVIIRGKRACVVMHVGPTYPKSGHKIKSMGKTNLVSPSYPYQKGKREKQKRGKSGALTLKNRYLFQQT